MACKALRVGVQHGQGPAVCTGKAPKGRETMKKDSQPRAERAPRRDLPILWRDEDYVVVYKPAGLLVHRTSIDRQASEFALQILRGQLGCHVFPVHRIDRPTAGVLMFATRARAVEPMAKLFQTDQVHKRYLGIARGHCDDALTLDTPLADVEDDYIERGPGRQDTPREACTQVRTLARTEVAEAVGPYQRARYSLLEITPLTGRRHQIRRHLKRANHPLVGDTSYGDGRHNNLFRQRFVWNRLCLCACELAFTHPRTQAPLRVFAAPDAEFLRLLCALGWRAQAAGLLRAALESPLA
jgi:tRNA pseudouridine65 synthase